MKAAEIFATRLRFARKYIGLTQEELADKLKVSRGAIAHWELGDREPNLKTLKSMSNLLNVSVEFLVGESDLMNQDKVAEYILNKLCVNGLIDEHNIDIDILDKYIEHLKLFTELNKSLDKK